MTVSPLLAVNVTGTKPVENISMFPDDTIMLVVVLVVVDVVDVEVLVLVDVVVLVVLVDVPVLVVDVEVDVVVEDIVVDVLVDDVEVEVEVDDVVEVVVLPGESITLKLTVNEVPTVPPPPEAVYGVAVIVWLPKVGVHGK